ncbi:TIGR03936 family radical SAM-associated protein [Chloroflexi bacterium TSY]|nr:TIGR03936 family radical SAM-associated protein [Chloroflexi bacterium TSY]
MTINNESDMRQRVRLYYEKGESIKFISHQDEFRLWERTLRRADLPLLYKKGFNPQPHIQFAAPLGVGFTGICEPLDITFSTATPLDTLRRRIEDKLPPGVRIHSIQQVPLKTNSLQSLLIGADYTVLLYAEPDELPADLIPQRIYEFLAKSEIWRERERKGRKYRYNLRPLIFELVYRGYTEKAEEHCIFVRVQQRAGATGRPDEVVSALGFDDFARTLRRERLYLSCHTEDVALYEQYPLIEQADISPEGLLGDAKRGRGRNRRGKKRNKHLRQGLQTEDAHSELIKGRSINERAGDEFV